MSSHVISRRATRRPRLASLLLVSAMVLAILVGAAAAAAATRSSSPSASSRLAAQTRTNLNVAYTVSTPNLFDIALFYAQNHRLFVKYGLNVKILMLNGDTLGLQALVSNTTDIGFFSNQLLYQGIEQGAGIAGFLENDPVHDYVLLSKSSIATPQGLAGHVLATSGPGGIAEVIPFLALQKEGVDTSTVKTVNAGGTSGRLTALLAGRVDAGMAHILDAGQFLAQHPGKQFKILMNLGKVLPRFQYAAFVANRSTIKSKRAALVQFSRAILEAQRKVAADFQTTYNEFHKYRPDLDRYSVLHGWRALKGIGAFNLDGGMLPANFAYTMNALTSKKLLAQPLTYQQVYDTSIRDAAMKYFPASPTKK